MWPFGRSVSGNVLVYTLLLVSYGPLHVFTFSLHILCSLKVSGIESCSQLLTGLSVRHEVSVKN